jgi:hypothetical protein
MATSDVEMGLERRRAIVFGLEVGSNDHAASAATRREAERCLRNQRVLARLRFQRDPMS